MRITWYALLLSVVVLVVGNILFVIYFRTSGCYVQTTKIWKVLVKGDVYCPDSDRTNFFYL